MSFRIFAMGTGGFRFLRENVPDSSGFTAAQVLQSIQSNNPNVNGAVEVGTQSASAILVPGAVNAAERVGSITHGWGVDREVRLLVSEQQFTGRALILLFCR